MESVIKKFDELSVNELYDILKLRVDVFVVEQNCPYPEIDDKDQNAYHVWLKDGEGITAYLRVIDKGVSFEDASIGRVISARRRKGYGTALLKEGIRIAKEKFGADKITIEAQVYARKFYENVGFHKVSEEFLEDGIPHIIMTLECE